MTKFEPDQGRKKEEQGKAAQKPTYISWTYSCFHFRVQALFPWYVFASETKHLS